MCAKFHAFWSIPSPSKTASCFMANTASPWQQCLMKTQKLQNEAPSRSYNLADQILHGSDKPPRSSSLKWTAYNFLLPVGGAMTMFQYCPANVFRPGLLSYMRNVGNIRPCGAELSQFVFSWRSIETRRVTMATVVHENSQASQCSITKVLRLFWPNLRWFWSTC